MCFVDDFEGLPFEKTGKIAESAGSDVLKAKSENVIKVNKVDFSTGQGITDVLEATKKLRVKENRAVEMALGRARQAIVPQNYVITEGKQSGTARVVRTQKYIEGIPLRKLGFWGILGLEKEERKTLEDLLLSSMKCYIKYGVNYDLFGSDEEDSKGWSRIKSIKRMVFPLSNSNNLMLTNEGIKLIDPNVLGSVGKKSLKTQLVQAFVFSTSLMNYMVLKTEDALRVPGSEHSWSEAVRS